MVELPTAHSTVRAGTPLPETVDVAIVGAGTSGLAAGAWLANAGLRVALFEKHYVAGGCGTRFMRGPCARPHLFDIGLHYVGGCHEGGAVSRVLDPVGANVEWVPLDPDGFDQICLPDFTFGVPASMELYRERLLEMFPAERRGIDRWIRLVRQVGVASNRMFARNGRITIPLMIRTLFDGPLAALFERATMRTFLKWCTKDERLRAVILGQHGTYGLPPSEASVMVHAGTFAHYIDGAWYPRGGGQAVSDRLAESIEAAGGSVHLRCGIDRVLVEDGRAVGVRTEPRRGHAAEVRAKVVLSCADLKQTLLQMVGPEYLSRRRARRLARLVMGPGIFMTAVAVDRDMHAQGMRAANYLQYDSYDMDDFYLANRRGLPFRTQGACITSGSLKAFPLDGGPSDPLCTIEAMAVLPGGPEAWGLTPEQLRDGSYRSHEGYLETKQRLEDELIGRIEAQFPGTAEHIVFRESATPLTHTRFTGASGGTGYGLAAIPGQFGNRRPTIKGPLRGLFLGGASTSCGHGIVGALMGGRAVARAISKHLGVSAALPS